MAPTPPLPTGGAPSSAAGETSPAAGETSPAASRRQCRRLLARTVRDAIWRMRNREDMAGVLAALRQGLLDLEIPIYFCGVNIIDTSVTPPGVISHSMDISGEWHQLQSVGARTILGFWEGGDVVYRRDLTRDDPYSEKRVFPDVGCIIDIPFAHGTLAASSLQPEAFGDDDVDLLEEMAGLLEDGFRRLDEIRRMEVRLAIREKVWQMRTTGDIEEVMIALREGFDRLGFHFASCGINLVLLDDHEPDDHVVMWHSMDRGQGWTQLGRSPLPLVVDFWRTGTPTYRRDLERNDPHGEQALLSDYYGEPVRCVIDVPFSHGTLALNSTEPNAFSDDQVQLLQELAGVLAEGFRRLDDLRALEERNQRLEVEIEERTRAERGLERSLAEKEILLREVHHRVKNNLQVVCSLLSLRANGITDEIAVQSFTDSRAQIESMALIHERLYESEDLGEIEGGTFLGDLARQVMASYGVDRSRIDLTVDVSPDAITVDSAIPCGLIVHELVSNCLKHAFPDAAAGTIRVQAGPAGDRNVRLCVRDDGVGLPPDFAPGGSLGLRLVEDLVRKLHGTLTIEDDGGACFEVLYPTGLGHG